MASAFTVVKSIIWYAALESNTVFLRQSNIKANTSIAYLYFMVKIVGKQLAICREYWILWNCIIAISQ